MVQEEGSREAPFYPDWPDKWFDMVNYVDYYSYKKPHCRGTI
jgi:hypothetical protein